MEHKHSPAALLHMQTLSHVTTVNCLDIRVFLNEPSHALLITGENNGQISVYNTALTRKQCIQFILLKCFQAHADALTVLHFHSLKLLFFSGADNGNAKIWSFKDGLSPPRMVKCIWHLNVVSCSKFSPSGLLVVGGENDSKVVLRVYNEAPLCSLVWKFEAAYAEYIYSVAWSPCNTLAASFMCPDRSNILHVWNSAFQTLFKLEKFSCSPANGLAFASNDVLVSSCAGGKLSWCHISSPPKVMKLLEESTLPFCRDVVKMIMAYLPPVMYIESGTVFGSSCHSVTNIGSQFIASLTDGGYSSAAIGVLNGLIVYKLHGGEPRLFARIPYPWVNHLAMCLLPGKGTAFLFACAHRSYKDVKISITNSLAQVWTPYQLSPLQGKEGSSNCLSFDVALSQGFKDGWYRNRRGGRLLDRYL